MGLSLWSLFKVVSDRDRIAFPSAKTLSLLPHQLYLYSLLDLLPRRQTGLLMTNALLILNRRRFLSKYGLDDLNTFQGGGGGAGQNPLQSQAVGLLHAVQYLKVPVIAANIITIIFELLLGGT